MLWEQIYTRSPLKNFTYLIYSEEEHKKPSERQKVFCIDPWDSEQIITLLEKRKVKLTHIINTHEHGDHTRGNHGLSQYYDVEILAHENAKHTIPHMTNGLKAGDRIPITDHSYFIVMDTPGHTFCHVSLLLYEDQNQNQNHLPQAIFSGDTFFNAGVGRCSSGGDPEVLYQTITQQYANIEDHIRIFPGHNYMENNLRFTLCYEKNNQEALIAYKEHTKLAKKGEWLSSTMGMERKINLFLRLNSRDLRKELEKIHPHFYGGTSGPSAEPSEKDIFLHLRQLRDRW